MRRQTRWQGTQGSITHIRMCTFQSASVNEGSQMWTALGPEEMDPDSDTEGGVRTRAGPHQTDSTEYEVRSTGEGDMVDWEEASIGSSPQYVISDSSSVRGWQGVEGNSSSEESAGRHGNRYSEAGSSGT